MARQYGSGINHVQGQAVTQGHLPPTPQDYNVLVTNNVSGQKSWSGLLVGAFVIAIFSVLTLRIFGAIISFALLKEGILKYDENTQKGMELATMTRRMNITTFVISIIYLGICILFPGIGLQLTNSIPDTIPNLSQGFIMMM